MSVTEPYIEVEDAIRSKVEADSKTRFAVRQYIRALERFESASKEFGEACNQVREVVPKQARFVIRVDYRDYLVTTDIDGSFEVEPIEVL